MNYKKVKKPRTMREQVDALWDITHNHVLTQLKWQSIKLNFVLVFMGLVLALLGVIILS